MVRAGGGKIINIGSMTSIFGSNVSPAYGATKGGVVQFTKSLALFWARDHIQPSFRTSLCNLSYFCVPLKVLYKLLPIRGDCHA